MADHDSDSDDFGYDLTLDDEKLLLSLTDDALPPARASQNLFATTRPVAHNNAAGSLSSCSSPLGRKAALVGVARTSSIDAFVRKTQPQSAPSMVPSDDVQYPDLSKVLNSLGQEREAATINSGDPVSPPDPGAAQPAEDTRSPLLRFRTFPKKPLSVSDLTAGAWCEQQYEYTLTRLPGGKKTRTVAMKEGSKVHQKLEDEVHTTIQVEIVTKEDAFGLKVWNILQGLRTLRDTGLTRELELWGIIDGDVVNGLIDHLSYENPDPQFEKEWLSSQESRPEAEDASQKKITNFFPSSQPPTAEGKTQAEPRKDTRKIYLTDVKTRGAKSVPKGSAIRPTKVQLFLYHRFLCDMAADRLNFLHVFQRYGLDVDAPFSDAFLAQIGELHDDIFHDSSSVLSSAGSPSENTRTHELLRYNTLRELVPLLRTELLQTFPNGADSIGSVVTVEYRLRGDEGALIGTNVLAVDEGVLNQYLDGYMQWWRGERAATGVDVEEAYKCSYCEFAEICTWREEMDRGHLMRAREKSAAVAKVDATPRTGSTSPMRSRRNSVSASPG